MSIFTSQCCSESINCEMHGFMDSVHMLRMCLQRFFDSIVVLMRFARMSMVSV